MLQSKEMSKRSTMTSCELSSLLDIDHNIITKQIEDLIDHLNPEFKYGIRTITFNDSNVRTEIFEMDREFTYMLVVAYDSDVKVKVYERWNEKDPSLRNIPMDY